MKTPVECLFLTLCTALQCAHMSPNTRTQPTLFRTGALREWTAFDKMTSGFEMNSLIWSLFFSIVIAKAAQACALIGYSVFIMLRGFCDNANLKEVCWTWYFCWVSRETGSNTHQPGWLDYKPNELLSFLLVAISKNEWVSTKRANVTAVKSIINHNQKTTPKYELELKVRLAYIDANNINRNNKLLDWNTGWTSPLFPSVS